MFNNEVKDFINNAVITELERSKEEYEEQFHSTHEAFAVLLEEWEECWENMRKIQKDMELLWEGVKTNHPITIKGRIKEINVQAYETALEFVQLCAMARKFMEYENEV